jgi:hypothetical protein
LNESGASRVECSESVDFHRFSMSRNALYAVIAVLAIVVVIFGIYTYQQQTRPGVEVRVDENGLSIQGNN